MVLGSSLTTLFLKVLKSFSYDFSKSCTILCFLFKSVMHCKLIFVESEI